MLRTGLCTSVPHLPTRLDGLIAGVTPLPADEVGNEDDEDQPRQGAAHSNGDQHVVTVLYTLFHCNRQPRVITPGSALCPPPRLVPTQPEGKG